MNGIRGGSEGIEYPGLVRRADMLAPVYIYPNPAGPWTQLNSCYPTMAYMVANPSSGPGASVDPFYASAITAAQAAGVTILGYVDTSYTVVLSSTVQANIGLWKSLYGITDIFFDQVSSDPGAHLAYYSTVCGYVTGRKVLNHGTIPDQGYAALGDVLAIFEGTGTSWATFAPAQWFPAYPPGKFAAFVYSVSGVAAMQSTVTQAIGYGIGNLYITDEADDLFNKLPGYLAQEVSTLSR